MKRLSILFFLASVAVAFGKPKTNGMQIGDSPLMASKPIAAPIPGTTPPKPTTPVTKPKGKPNSRPAKPSSNPKPAAPQQQPKPAPAAQSPEAPAAPSLNLTLAQGKLAAKESFKTLQAQSDALSDEHNPNGPLDPKYIWRYKIEFSGKPTFSNTSCNEAKFPKQALVAAEILQQFVHDGSMNARNVEGLFELPTTGFFPAKLSNRNSSQKFAGVISKPSAKPPEGKSAMTWAIPLEDSANSMAHYVEFTATVVGFPVKGPKQDLPGAGRKVVDAKFTILVDLGNDDATVQNAPMCAVVAAMPEGKISLTVETKDGSPIEPEMVETKTDAPAAPADTTEKPKVEEAPKSGDGKSADNTDQNKNAQTNTDAKAPAIGSQTTPPQPAADDVQASTSPVTDAAAPKKKGGGCNATGGAPLLTLAAVILTLYRRREMD